MSTAVDFTWMPLSSGLPRRDSRVAWIAPDGRTERGTFVGGAVWIPEGSNCYVYYTPTMWRYL